MTTSSDDPVDPTRLESTEFELVRRGFDPSAVRAALQAAAREIRRLTLERDEFEGRLAELEGAPPAELEAHRIAEVLGSEATKVLEAAHTAASERSERAEREAEAIVQEARAAADATRSEAQEAADTVRAQAGRARDEMLEEARREAETIVEEGRARGREMVTEAQNVRERMLRDLARKRQAGRAQVEQLRAGRDRLLESLSTAQDSLQVAVDDLVRSVPEARAAAERAGVRVTSEPTPTAEDMEAEIDTARAVGHPLVDTGETPALDSDPFTTDELEAIDPLDVLEDEPGAPPVEQVASGDETEAPGEADAAGQDATAEDVTAEHDVAGEDVAGEEGAAEDDDRGVVDEGPPEGAVGAPAAHPDTGDAPELYDIEAEEGTGERDTVETDTVESDTAESDTAEEEAAGDAGDELFARLRSSRAGAVSAAEHVLGAADEAAAAVAEDAENEVAEDGDDAGEETPTDERAESLAAAAAAAAKAMKKVLVEEQGALLDGIRRSGAAAVLAVIEDVAAHDKAYDAAASGPLKDLASDRGATRRLDIKPALAQIHAIALDPVRQRLAEVAERLEDPDELSDTVRALYRESRSRRIPEAAAAAATAVDALVVLATANGSVRWEVEAGGPCGADCADNALAGAVDPGTPFPTGDLHPPAHPACTCRLVPVDDGD